MYFAVGFFFMWLFKVESVPWPFFVQNKKGKKKICFYFKYASWILVEIHFVLYWKNKTIMSLTYITRSRNTPAVMSRAFLFPYFAHYKYPHCLFALVLVLGFWSSLRGFGGWSVLWSWYQPIIFYALCLHTPLFRTLFSVVIFKLNNRICYDFYGLNEWNSVYSGFQYIHLWPFDPLFLLLFHVSLLSPQLVLSCLPPYDKVKVKCE